MASIQFPNLVNKFYYSIHELLLHGSLQNSLNLIDRTSPLQSFIILDFIKKNRNMSSPDPAAIGTRRKEPARAGQGDEERSRLHKTTLSSTCRLFERRTSPLFLKGSSHRKQQQEPSASRGFTRKIIGVMTPTARLDAVDVYESEHYTLSLSAPAAVNTQATPRTKPFPQPAAAAPLPAWARSGGYPDTDRRCVLFLSCFTIHQRDSLHLDFTRRL